MYNIIVYFVIILSVLGVASIEFGDEISRYGGWGGGVTLCVIFGTGFSTWDFLNPLK